MGLHERGTRLYDTRVFQHNNESRKSELENTYWTATDKRYMTYLDTKVIPSDRHRQNGR